MSDYIERDDDNQSQVTTDPVNPDAEIIEARWSWIKGWDYMDTYEKRALFLPTVKFIYPRDEAIAESESPYYDTVSETFLEQISDFEFTSCRPVVDIQYQLNNNSVPTWSVVFGPVNINEIPYPEIKTKVYTYGAQWGLTTNVEIQHNVKDFKFHVNSNL